MSWTNITKNIATLTNKVRNLLYYFWGTHDDKYVVDHLGRKIIFFNNDYTNTNRQSATWANKNKS